MGEPKRLIFSQDVFNPEDQYPGKKTCGVQGKMFYCSKNEDGTLQFYTQSREDVPEKMYVRGHRVPTELLELIHKISELLDTDKVFCFMICDEHLLITHRQISGPQIFFLGCLEDEVFTPTAFLYEEYPVVKEKLDSEGIKGKIGYGEPGKMYFPEKIVDPETLEKVIEEYGGFIHTGEEGVPVTILHKNAMKIFHMCYGSQNNTQLYVKIFFHHPFEDGSFVLKPEDLEERNEYCKDILPNQKNVHFLECTEKFKIILRFFCGRKGAFALKNHKAFSIDTGDGIGENHKKKFEDCQESLKTFINILKTNLKSNRLKREKRKPLQEQIEKAVFDFFKYEPNVNNCCRLLKIASDIIII
jgi:hypothetical protein